MRADAAPGAPRSPAAPGLLGLDGQPDPRPDAAFVDVVRRSARRATSLPAPGDVPRALWKQRLQDMARFSLTRIGLPPGRESALATLDLEPFAAYFEARAPETLPRRSPGPRPTRAASSGDC